MIVLLMVIAVLVSLSVGFHAIIQTEILVGESQYRGYQARYMALTGLEFAVLALRLDPSYVSTASDPLDVVAFDVGELVAGRRSETMENFYYPVPDAARQHLFDEVRTTPLDPVMTGETVALLQVGRYGFSVLDTNRDNAPDRIISTGRIMQIDGEGQWVRTQAVISLEAPVTFLPGTAGVTYGPVRQTGSHLRF